MSDGGSPVNRKTIRQAIAAGLAANMPSAQAVYGYQRSKFDGRASVVRVFSASADRPMFAEQGIRSEFGFIVQLWVLYASPTTQVWSESEAEDKLDDLEYELISWIVDNQVPADMLWTALRYARGSVVDTHKVGGESYLVEDVFVVAEVYG